MKTKRVLIGSSLLLIMFFVTAKLLGMHIGLYAEHNTGTLYWLGFILGLVLLLGSGGGSYATRRRWYE